MKLFTLYEFPDFLQVFLTGLQIVACRLVFSVQCILGSVTFQSACHVISCPSVQQFAFQTGVTELSSKTHFGGKGQSDQTHLYSGLFPDFVLIVLGGLGIICGAAV